MTVAYLHLPILEEESFVHYMSLNMGLNAELRDVPIKRWLRLRHVQSIKNNGRNTYIYWHSQSVVVTKWKFALGTTNNWKCATMWCGYCMCKVCQIWVTNKYIGIFGTSIPNRRIQTSIYLHGQSMSFALNQYCQLILGCSLEENNLIYCWFLPLYQPLCNRLLVSKVVQSCI